MTTKRKSSGGVLIVVELGADWPSLPESREPAAGRRVLAQQEGESPAAFGARVADQLDSLFTRGVPLATAVIACNERLDEAAQRARADLARTAMGSMARRQSGSLLLTASERQSGRLRHALSALVGELGDEWQRARVTAKLRFGEEQLAQRASDMAIPVSSRARKDSSRKVA
ncbi:MAG TPA: hypothetical protein VK745_32615 [Polyangiaceae bacterium]|jgi:hypothetical protein|nr:hypothetical protein [Polyangiaceae bacterium]